jgi:hypothetical protein
MPVLKSISTKSHFISTDYSVHKLIDYKGNIQKMMGDDCLQY